MSGAIYDVTGSYQAAFLNGIAWNLNMSIAFWLLLGHLRPCRRDGAELFDRIAPGRRCCILSTA